MSFRLVDLKNVKFVMFPDLETVHARDMSTRHFKLYPNLMGTWQEIYPCMAQLGDELCACPDWTPLEPRFRSRGSLKELVALPKALIPVA